MKIAFTTSGNDLEGALEARFGRAQKFLVFDLEKSTFEVISNEDSAQTSQGAGIQAAEKVARSGAQSLVTGHCGPKAFRVLAAAGIKVYCTQISKISEALEAFRNGKLAELKTPDVEGHWV